MSKPEDKSPPMSGPLKMMGGPPSGDVPMTSKPEDESEHDKCIKEVLCCAQQINTLHENKGLCTKYMVQITNLVIELSAKQFFNNRRLGFLKKTT
jgi:hypothetical protein